MNRRFFLLTFILCLITIGFIFPEFTEAVVCPSEMGVGTGGVVASHADTLVESNTVYIMKQHGVVGCFGVIEEWKYYKKDVCEDVTFQVWRPEGGDTFTLVGENIYSAAHCNQYWDFNVVSFRIPENQRIVTQIGDVIGWKQGGTDLGMIPWTDTIPNALTYQSLALMGCPVSVGDAGCIIDQSVDRSPALSATLRQAKPPTLDNLPVTINFYENEPVDRLAFVVAASFKYNSYTNVMDNAAPIKLTVNSTDFYIEETGEIKSNISLDYESSRRHVVSVNATAAGITVQKELTINVMDVNEPHTLINLPASRTISALLRRAGDVIFSVEASDIDGEELTSIGFYLRSWSTNPNILEAPYPPFQVDQLTGEVSCSMDLDQLVIPGTPDSVEYLLLVKADDGQFVSNETLTVTITNLRQTPIFVNLPATIDIPEDLPSNSVIYKVIGSTYGFEQSKMNFAVDRSTPLATRNKFSMNSEGEIVLRGGESLDYTNVVRYDITVVGNDGYLETSSDVLTINVNWANKAPEFKVPSQTINIQEKCGNVDKCCASGAGCVLPVAVPGLSFSVYDRDVSRSLPPFPRPTDALTCTLLPGYGSHLFLTDIPDCDTLYVNDVIDVDTNPGHQEFNLTIKVSDNYGGSGLGFVRIKVDGINDHAPLILPPSLVASVKEGDKGGSVIQNFSVDDPDSGSNGQVTFSLKDSDGSPGTTYFWINPDTGVLSTKQPLDYEKYATLQFEVVATDRGSPALTSSALVTINVTDVNDFSPQWDCSTRDPDLPYNWGDLCLYNLELRADVATDFVAAQVFAADADGVTYKNLKPDDSFTLDESDGIISVSKALEENKKYMLYPYAVDKGDPPFKSNILWVRIDSYDPDKYLLEMKIDSSEEAEHTTNVTDVNATAPSSNVSFADLQDLITNKYNKSWIIRPDVAGEDSASIAFYVLRDNSTYSTENLQKAKEFVPKEEILELFTVNGEPTDEFIAATGVSDGQKLSSLKPARVNWWTQTKSGIAVLCFLCLLGLILLLLLVVVVIYLASRFCFNHRSGSSVSSSKIDVIEADEASTVNERPRIRNRHTHRVNESAATE